mgnify:CR=1 FL=1
MASDAVSNSRDGSEFVTVYSFGEKEERRKGEGRKEKTNKTRKKKNRDVSCKIIDQLKVEKESQEEKHRRNLINTQNSP